MTILDTTYLPRKLGSLWRNIRPVDRLVFDAIVEGEMTYKDSDALFTFVEEVRRAMQSISEDFDRVQTKVAGAPHVAWQHCEVTAAMLSSSDDPDGNPVERSVLTTASQSKYEFNFMLAGIRPTKIAFGIGRGVPDYPLIIDANDVNLMAARLEALGDSAVLEASPSVRPWGMSGVCLQWGQWKPRTGKMEFWPTNIAVGTWFSAWQVLPPMKVI